MLSYMCSSYILEINPLPDILFANIFSHSGGSLLVLLIVFFSVQKLFILMWCHLFIFFFCFPFLRRHIQKNIAKTDVRKCTAYVSSRIFMISGLTFWSSIHFSYFCIGCEKVVQFDSFACSFPVFPAPFVEEAVFFPLCILASFVIYKLNI